MGEADKKILFQEEQRMSESIAKSIFLVTAILVIIIMVVLALRGVMTAMEARMPILVLLVTYILTYFLFQSTRLETKITEDGIYYRWRPFMKKFAFVGKNEIKKAVIRKSPWMQYGFNYFPGYGRIHNVQGREGVQLYLKAGGRIFVGTQKLFEFKKALEILVRVESKI